MKLKIDNIGKTFINNKVEHKVLEDINLDIKEGEFVSLLGPSGCGKTTLLTIIGGFQTCENGQVLLDNKVVDKPGIDRAFVFQNYALFPWKTVKGNVEFPMKQQKCLKRKRTEIRRTIINIRFKGKRKDVSTSAIRGNEAKGRCYKSAGM